jgi:polyphosphate glucokinase
MDVLVVDIGGSQVKMLASGGREPRTFDSGRALTPESLVTKVRESTSDWKYDVISIGYPGAVDARGPSAEPGNLAHGWLRFDFSKAFGKPVRVLNDAAMQALGGYDGGRMLFIGLGTGVGSALVTEHVVVPLELGCLPYAPGETIVERIGAAGLEAHGEQAWLAAVTDVTRMLREAFAADYVLLGGGNSTRVHPLPDGTRRGGNEDAFTGGFRLWEEMVEPHDRRSSPAWRVVR